MLNSLAWKTPGKEHDPKEVIMTRYIAIVLGVLLTPALLLANPGKPDIVVITQNQYLALT